MYTHINFTMTVFTKLVDINFIKCISGMRKLAQASLRGQSFIPGCYACWKHYESHHLEPLIVLACGHSYHLRCLDLSEKVQYHCPMCLNDPKIFVLN
jgi:hypothetical protein